MDFPDHFQHIFTQLNHQRRHAQLCDCVVVVGGRSFQAHRSILAACSSHFRALLSSSDGAENVEADTSVFPIEMKLDPEVVTPEAFSTLLDMIYTSTLSLGASNVMDVLLAASYLHLNAVVKACKLHLSRKNFPSSPPQGWRSLQQQQQQCSQAERFVTSVVEEGIDEEEVGVEVTQSVGFEDQGVSRSATHGQSSPFVRHKRKPPEDLVSGRKRPCRLLEGHFKERSPTVTRSSINADEPREELLPPDCQKMTNTLWDGRGEEDEKYEATKGESEEIQLPSQSDSITGGSSACQKDGGTEKDPVVKVKVGEEGEDDEPRMVMIEVKKENQNPCSPVRTENLDTPQSDEKMATAGPTECDVSSLQAQLGTDLHMDSQREAGDFGEESVDAGDGLDSLSELTFSCLLNPNCEMGALEGDDSLASLTHAAAAGGGGPKGASGGGPEAEGGGGLEADGGGGREAEGGGGREADGGEPNQKSEARSSNSSSSLIFPVSSVPLQQLLPTRVSGFSDTLILHPTHSSLAGFLSGIRPGLCLGPSLIKPSSAGKSSAATTFRRIAPKVPAGSVADTDHSSASAGDAACRPLLSSASLDVLSKCKKAAAEDLVLLVEGEKKYACKICCKTFMTLTDCKKHIRIHTGEKPYSCPKCGKCFNQSSHLYKHTKNTCLNWKDHQSLPDTLL